MPPDDADTPPRPPEWTWFGKDSEDFLAAARTGAAALLKEYNEAGQPFGVPTLGNVSRWYRASRNLP